MEEVESQLPVPFLNAKRMVLVEISVFFVVMTMLQAGFDRNRYVSAVLTVFFSVGYGVGLLAWCKADSVLRGYQLDRRFPYAIVLLGTFAFIYYLFRSRGFVKGLVGVVYFCLFAMVTFVVSVVAAIIVLIAKMPFEPHYTLPAAG